MRRLQHMHHIISYSFCNVKQHPAKHTTSPCTSHIKIIAFLQQKTDTKYHIQTYAIGNRPALCNQEHAMQEPEYYCCIELYGSNLHKNVFSY